MTAELVTMGGWMVYLTTGMGDGGRATAGGTADRRTGGPALAVILRERSER